MVWARLDSNQRPFDYETSIYPNFHEIEKPAMQPNLAPNALMFEHLRIKTTHYHDNIITTT